MDNGEGMEGYSRETTSSIHVCPNGCALLYNSTHTFYHSVASMCGAYSVWGVGLECGRCVTDTFLPPFPRIFFVNTVTTQV